jgi:hypothetical protein
VEHSSPAPLPRRRAPFTPGERRRIALAAATPVVLGLVVLTPVAVFGSATALEVVTAAVVYGGLLGLAAAFVAVDRLQSRQCPRCTTRNERGATACVECAYDVVRRPRYACAERHQVYVGPGLCDCGRRLQEQTSARGVGPEIRWMLRTGGWILAFLMAAGVVLQFLSR